jgi:hypothetical protein
MNDIKTALKHLWLYVILVLPDRKTELGHLSQVGGYYILLSLTRFFTWRSILDVIMLIFFLLFIQLVAFHKSV